MLSPLSPTMHTNLSIVKPYTFLNPLYQAHVTFALMIDPQLNLPPPSCTHRAKFSTEDLEQLIHFAIEKEPWTKPHGQVMKSWGVILKQLQSEGCFKTSSFSIIQNKLNALVAW